MTLNYKKLEVPIKKILMGWEIEKAVNLDSIMNPDAVFEVRRAAKPYVIGDRWGEFLMTQITFKGWYYDDFKIGDEIVTGRTVNQREKVVLSCILKLLIKKRLGD